jgi:outer membrane immunogenic protein
MKKLAVLFASLALTSGAAVAADMPVKARPMPMAVFSWTGCYIGADVGGVQRRQSADDVTIPAGFNSAPTSATINAGGVAGGAYAGCNYQFGSRWVIGLEGDWSATGLKGSATAANLFANGTPVGSGGVFYNDNVNWIATLRGRLGYAVRPNVLLYVTGGGAWADTSVSGLHAFNGGCPNCSATAVVGSNVSGWVAGGGVDWAPWSNHWVVRAEGLYYNLGFDGSNIIGLQQTNLAQTTAWSFHRSDVYEGRVGISYKFGPMGAVVAKY